MAAQSENVLVVKREFSAPIERVFDAWTNAGVLAQWFGPEDFEVTDAEIDLIVGGRYEINMVSPDGNSVKHFGFYVEISAPDKLIFTWVLEDQACEGSKGQSAKTLVSIDFKRINQMTAVTLTHERLPNKEAYDGHQFGWNSSFESLAAYL